MANRNLQSLLLLVLTSFAQAQVPDPDAEARRDVWYLTSSEMKGRGYYHGGHLRAARYIGDRFRALGLDSLSDRYLQQFPMTVNEFPSTPVLVVDGKRLEFGRDYLVDEGSGSGKGKGRLLYAGSGVVVPEKGINEYDGKDVEGAIVVIDETVPDALKNDTTIDRGYFSRDLRAEVAAMLGARNVIILVDRLTFGKQTEAAKIPIFDIRRDAFPSGAKEMEYAVENLLHDVTTQNVVAWLPGAAHRDSMLILCAHYDHLGAVGESIYFPGANDNASGVAMLLAFARYFKEHPPKYSVAFIAFSGEEAGLIGSRYFSEHPMFDLRKARFLLNLDMTASGKEGIMAVGGVDFPEEFELLRAVADSFGVKQVSKRPNAPNSDHFFLIRSGVRGFYIYPFTGYQPYHHIDDKPETLEWDVFARLRKIYTKFLEKL